MAIVLLPGRNSTTITATAEHEVYIYKSVILYLDGLIRRHRVLALGVLGAASTLPYTSNQRWWTVEGVNSMPLSKDIRIGLLVEANCAKPSVCKLLLQYLVLFTIVIPFQG